MVSGDGVSKFQGFGYLGPLGVSSIKRIKRNRVFAGLGSNGTKDM